MTEEYFDSSPEILEISSDHRGSHFINFLVEPLSGIDSRQFVHKLVKYLQSKFEANRIDGSGDM